MTARRANGLVTFAIVGGLLLSSGGVADAQTIETGPLEVVSASGDPIAGGGSATPFGLELPDDATCPGDSRNDGYRVNSYMVPESVTPTDVTYDGLGPAPQRYRGDGSFQMPLYQEDSASFVSVQTADAERPGDPGVIVDLPRFDFDVYAPGDVPAGRYHVGIACTLLNEITRVWDAEVVVTEDPADEPAQLRWSVVGFDPTDDSSTPILPIAAGAAAITALIVLYIRRRRPAATPLGRNA